MVHPLFVDFPETLNIIFTPISGPPPTMRLTLHKRKIAALLAVLGTMICVFMIFFSSPVEDPDSQPRTLGTRTNLSWFQQPRGSPQEMRLAVYRHNLHQAVLNAKLFPGTLEQGVVVQVRGGPGSGPRLQLLVDSLKTAGPRATRHLLLVFSLEKPCPEVAKVIHSIDFCQVLSILYPYSQSLFSNEFPGTDPADCPRDLPKESAIASGCNNAQYPDSHGHYREAVFTQDKHHWWWKLHYIWERVRELSGYSGHLLFLEEGSYLLPDWSHMMRFMQRECREQGCQILSLGGTSKSEPPVDPQQVDVGSWVAPKHRSAIAMPREVYYKLMGCLAEFCTYDDYNWDWSLQYVLAKCLVHPLKVMSTRLPRVLNLPAKENEDGMCARTGPCASTDSAAEALRVQVRELSGRLFPKTLAVATQEQEAQNAPQIKNGGWADVRDHSLCQSYARL